MLAVRDRITANIPKIIRKIAEIARMTHQLLNSPRPSIPAVVELYANPHAEASSTLVQLASPLICVSLNVTRKVVMSARIKTAIPSEITTAGRTSIPIAPLRLLCCFMGTPSLDGCSARSNHGKDAEDD